VRAWLQLHGKEKKSVCEVLEMEGEAVVAEASIFYSHVQLVPMTGLSGTLDRIEASLRLHRGEGETAAFLWFDFFTLRQCQKDFSLMTTLAVLGKIQKTVAEIGCTDYTPNIGSGPRENVALEETARTSPK